ncbi:MAG: acetyl/propionyl/methylcrotonyl-CoA carboxylase subunit alpha [Granulosicoccus sp.]|nr:acetyl/propionyl/methylcrotonyl-CoA carboxylase subunit alpha [Granulosicoccus sp.]
MSSTAKKIDTLLIANRGEIACRIIRTAKRLGIKTVAVFSEADANSLHVQLADEAIAIGGSASADSYLVMDRIIDAARTAGAQAIHPGFGFLSENAQFAKALADANLTFVGPGIKAIEVMGDKIESKKLAQQAGVNTVPGHPDAVADAAQAVKVAGDIGCPVMLKASAGGGGKGMRIAWTIDEVHDGFISAQNEARNAFGDDRVFVEKFIERPRHIEIQVLADSQGNCIYLGERECSIQRRHQKVIEEAPSPFLDEKTREAMGKQAVMLAQAVDYVSAGTVEFIVDKDRNFYFLEMNTRLQVEHPVTECITGLDLVEQMIRIAEGQALPLTQNEVVLDGWAIEARVYAEDPDRQFMPSTGRLTRYQPPEESEQVRVDTGVFEGGEISMYYDPMIAKLVTYGSTRGEAIEAMSNALDAYVIRGVNHNIAFLTALIEHPEFQSGNLTTAFIDEHYPDGFNSSSNTLTDSALTLVAAAYAQQSLDQQSQQLAMSGAQSAAAQMTNSDSLNELVAIVGEQEFHIRFDGDQFSVDGEVHRFHSDWLPGKLLMQGHFNDEPFTLQIDKEGVGWRVTQGGNVSKLLLVPPHVAQLHRLMPHKTPPDLSKFLLSPMPGLLMRVAVSVGDNVNAGQELAVVEAMKMENVLTAAQDGIVKAIPNSAGSSLAVDEVIVEFE